MAEQAERWCEGFDLRVYTMHVGPDVDVSGLEVRRIPRLPGPHLARFIWWILANGALRGWDTLRSGPPHAVVSPGVNALSADVIGVHIVFSSYWRRVREHLIGDLHRPDAMIRAVHRIVYVNIARWLERYVYKGPATLWALSPQDEHALVSMFDRPAGTIPMVPSGVDVEVFREDRRLRERGPSREKLRIDRERVILLIGNDIWLKGVDLAVRALQHLAQDIVLAVAGRIDPASIRQIAVPLGVWGRVRVWPHRADPFLYYAAADALVAPSRGEAFPLPVVEAMAAGLPVVVSGLAGVSQIVDDGGNGLVVRDPEDIEELVDKIETALSETTAEKVAKGGRALAEQMTWEANASTTSALIEREISTPRFLVLSPHSSGVGGIQRSTRNLALALAERIGGDRVGILSVWGGRSHLPVRTLYQGPLWEHGRRVSLAGKASYMLHLVRLARRWKRRLVIVACHPHLAPAARIAARLTAAPYAVWCHGDEVWAPLRRSVRSALRVADLVFAPSRFTAEQAVRWAGLTRVPTVVPHGVTPDLEAGEPARPMSGRVLAVARLEPEDRYKGVDTLITVWPQVLAALPQAELVVVGEGRDRSWLERLAASSGVDGSVRFVGGVDDAALSELYRTAELFALPARARVGPGAAGEGFGLVFLEAAMAGLPVVAGRSGAVPEVVEDGETGLVVDPEDPTAVVGAIRSLLLDPALRARMGRTARERIERSFTHALFRDRIVEMLGGLATVVRT